MLKDILSILIGFSGVGLISYGAYLIYPAAGFIVVGLSLLLFSFLMSRATAYGRMVNKKQQAKKSGKQ
ncbi:MAG: hypothetical protein HRT38_09695 [Alteromonadaceae bacterium]|nr:hypothetical protein [Alteromonadaceae bacterium]